MPPKICSVPSSILFTGLQHSILRANDLCHTWSNGLRSLQSVGTEFVLHHEVTKYLYETLNDPVDFDFAPIEYQLTKEVRGHRKVSRNTRRRYLVVRSGKNEKIAFARTQRFQCVDYFASEVIGAARAVQRYGFVEAAVIVGVIGSPCDPVADTARWVYKRIGAAVKTPSTAELTLDVPDETLQRQFGDRPPILMARVRRAP